MPSVQRSVLVPYRCEQMFDLVRDVPSYPRFLPWCSGASSVPEPGAEEPVRARIDISYLGVRAHFATRNTHAAPHAIHLALSEGPFRSLTGHWRFTPLGEAGCRVALELEYHFAGGLLARAVAPVFDKVANSLIDAFAVRADQLYGKAG
jgi:ribosome-associated toxin RatA of RatAB toxin-antitoxin module